MYGLLGKSLGHSFSKDYFTGKFSKSNLNHTYNNIELDDISKIVSYVKENKNLKGFNVTVPYKESIIPYLDDIDDIAEEVGAVNTVKVYENGKLKGFNTDVVGFKAIICQLSAISKTGRALIFGSGGASKAVQYVFKQEEIDFDVVSRDIAKTMNYNEVNKIGFKPYSIMINATPVGMFPNVNECLELPYYTIESRHVFIDLIYNPEETMFLKKARLEGAATFNGMKMLHEQAEAAWDIWRTLEF